MSIHLTPILLIASALSAASGPVWLESSWEFGTVAETQGRVGGRVRMVNTSGSPITVERVKSTCGCTSVSWPETPVLPGDTAAISFTYDPAGRPGRIDKRLKVYMEGCDTPHEIRLTGMVIPSEETLAYSYPVDCGDLRLATDMVDAGTLHPGVARHLFVYLYNRGQKPLLPSGRADDPRIKVTVTPDTLPPGESGTLVIQWLIPQGTPQGETSASVMLDGHRISLSGLVRHPGE
ncbi:MAG: DUF1573 domain-containing protein [Muribaculaceae bacterium]|nr:DUF1573 domain-containing protein [Muribaculaceae bacterium]